MNGFLARVVDRTLGNGVSLRPVTNRWSISRAPGLPLETSSAAEPDTRTIPSRERGDARNDGARSAARHTGDTRLVDGRVDADVAPPVAPSRGRRHSAGGRSTDVAERVDEPAVVRGAGRPQPADGRAPDGGYGADRTRESAGDVADLEARRAPRLLPQQAAPAIAARPAAAATRQTVARATEPAPVYVHIGRIDVRAVEAPVPKSSPVRAPLRAPSLESHLRSRDRGAT